MRCVMFQRLPTRPSELQQVEKGRYPRNSGMVLDYGTFRRWRLRLSGPYLLRAIRPA